MVARSGWADTPESHLVDCEGRCGPTQLAAFAPSKADLGQTGPRSIIFDEKIETFSLIFKILNFGIESNKQLENVRINRKRKKCVDEHRK